LWISAANWPRKGHPMAPERWDKCCPHCEKKIDDLYNRWANSGEYPTEMKLNCPHCGKVVDVWVIKVPEFALSKPEKGQSNAK